MLRRSQIYLFFLLLLVVFGPTASGLAEETQSVEYKLKAAYLYNFAKFVQWPEDSFSAEDAPFRICLFGEHHFEDSLEKLETRIVRGRKIDVLAIESLDDPEKLRTCQILFVGKDEIKRWELLFASLGEAKVLTVTETRFVGIINFVIISDSVRFEVNLENARNRGLRVDARMLKIATGVRE